MRIYLAAPWVRKAEAQAAAERLEAAGHTITKKWWDHREVPGYLRADISNAEFTELQVQMMEDIAGVLTAEVFVLLNLEKSEGKAVETGIAITAECILFLVGERSNLFHYDPLFSIVPTIDDVIARLAVSDLPFSA